LYWYGVATLCYAFWNLNLWILEFIVITHTWRWHTHTILLWTVQNLTYINTKHRFISFHSKKLKSFYFHRVSVLSLCVCNCNLLNFFRSVAISWIKKLPKKKWENGIIVPRVDSSLVADLPILLPFSTTSKPLFLVISFFFFIFYFFYSIVSLFGRKKKGFCEILVS
jgi:hypothetical protein